MIYNIGGSCRKLAILGALNKKWNSIKMGNSASLLTWNHYNGTGAVEWMASKDNLVGTDNYQCFSVLETSTLIIGVKFKDTTGAPNGQYSLLVKCADIGDVTLLSNEDDNYNPVGTSRTGRDQICFARGIATPTKTSTGNCATAE